MRDDVLSAVGRIKPLNSVSIDSAPPDDCAVDAVGVGKNVGVIIVGFHTETGLIRSTMAGTFYKDAPRRDITINALAKGWYMAAP